MRQRCKWKTGREKILKVRGLKVITSAGIAFMDEQGKKKAKRLFGARVRNLRLKQGMSQEALALTCELDRTYIGGVERGERNISLINIHKIADALGVPVGELF
jgi:DNA-binding XRE family transcriptional regulator